MKATKVPWHPYPSSSGNGPCPICHKPLTDPVHSSRGR